MKLKQALSQARTLLIENDIEDASLEAEVLLRHVTGKTRAQFFADLDDDISSSQLENYTRLIERRVRSEPTAYITGHKEFYGLDFVVNPSVLIPRPETEMLVDKAISLCREFKYSKAADIGTGCGAIAVSLAVNVPRIDIYAMDISSEALQTARQNCEKHGAGSRITLLQSDLEESLPERVDLIIANLPYGKQSDIPGEGPLSYEPKTAIDGGERGLDKIERLCRGVGEKLKANGSLLLEIGEGQAGEVESILHKYFPAGKPEVEKDLAGIERLVALRLT